MQRAFWIIAHRGASAHAPENTLLSFRKALALQADAIELDVQLSRDGHPMVIHDDTLERTTNGAGSVASLSRAQLQALDAGGGERIPALDDVFDVLDRRARLFIELKHPACAGPAAGVIERYLARGWTYEAVHVCSFNHRQLEDMLQRLPKLRVCALVERKPDDLVHSAQTMGCWAINPDIRHATRTLVDDARRRGLRVFPWTANDESEIARALALGADGVHTDDPGLARRHS